MTSRKMAAEATTRSEGSAPSDKALAAIQQRTHDWYAANDWTLFDFQREAWSAWHAGESGLIHSPTGSGKTLAAWIGPMQAALAAPAPPSGLNVLWITPLRALASDTRRSLEEASQAHDSTLVVALRTGDTTSAQRSKQAAVPPFALVTTPESLSVMLSSPASEKSLASITTVIVDEWHELMATKRGVQLELCLARVRTLNPDVRIWGLSATLANLDVAMQTLLGQERVGRLIRGLVPRAIEIDSLRPGTDTRFPWAGHIGLQLVEPAARQIEKASTTLAFTNTRAQAEIWYHALLAARP